MDGEGNVINLFTMGVAGALQSCSQSLSQTLVPCPFGGGEYPSLATGPAGVLSQAQVLLRIPSRQGYPSARTGNPNPPHSPGQVILQAVCIVWFPTWGLSCMWKFSHCSRNGTKNDTDGLPSHFVPFLVPITVHCGSLNVLYLAPFPLAVWKLRHNIVPSLILTEDRSE